MSVGRASHRLLAGATRARLLDVLRASDATMGVVELADALGLHPNSVREQLGRLVDAGLVERTQALPTGRGRPALRYRARADAEEGAPFRALARALADQLARTPDPAAASVAAGTRWGRSLVSPTGRATTEREAVDRLVVLLGAVGFEADAPDHPSDPIRLQGCPFDPLAREHGAVICGVHLGLMRGALDTLGAPLDALDLRPYAEPGLCLAQLGPRTHA